MRASTENKEKLLRLALSENMMFSAASGIALLAAPGIIAGFLGEAVPHWLMLALGAGLLVFAAGLLRQVLRRPLHRGEALVTIVMDEVWVIASILLLVLAPHWFSSGGQWLVGGVAAAVAAIATVQWIGLRRLGGDEIRFSFCRHVAAPPERVWPVISDHEGYAEVADNLSRVEVVAGEGLGMARRCTDTKGRGWNETCVLWDEGRAYSFAVYTSDYPFPLKEVRGTWGVEPAPGGSTITMEFDILPKYGALGRMIIGTGLKLAFSGLCERLLDKWAARILVEVERATPHRRDAA
jgi:hypothetical protein